MGYIGSRITALLVGLTFAIIGLSAAVSDNEANRGGDRKPHADTLVLIDLGVAACGLGFLGIAFAPTGPGFTRNARNLESCVKCRYDIRDIPADVCPECGTPITIVRKGDLIAWLRIVASGALLVTLVVLFEAMRVVEGMS